jgi:hypothetical protein
MAEIWKPVPSLPGVMASDEGRILLPPKHAAMPNGSVRLYLPKPNAGVIAKSHKNAKHLYRNYWTREFGNIKVHQAVCEAFHGPRPFETAVVIHADEDGLNNFAANLRWGTQKENLSAPGFRQQISDRAKTMHRVRGSGTKGGFAKAPTANPALEHRIG